MSHGDLKRLREPLLSLSLPKEQTEVVMSRDESWRLFFFPKEQTEVVIKKKSRDESWRLEEIERASSLSLSLMET